MFKRKIAVITGTRAEYGLLYWTLRELKERGVELQLIVTGAHLAPGYDMTVKHIEADGWSIAARIDMQLASDAPVDLARSMGLGLSGIAEALDRLKPDIVVILGDRYEMLAAASGAVMLDIPVAHIHGGEVTEGAMDELIRHAITKLSYWHFAPYAQAEKRILQLGEDPSRVFMVGAPGIDNIARLELLSREALEKELGISLAPPLILFTYHPETLSTMPVAAQIAEVTAALAAFPDATIIITGAGADSGGRAVNAALEQFAASHPRVLFRMSLGSRVYLSAMKQAQVVAGNSSSALIEAPALGRATVNIGDRQTGRLRSPGVIDCRCNAADITQGLRRALSPEFQQSLIPSTLFGTPGEVGRKIAHLLCTLDLPASLRKPFHDKAA